MKVFKTVKPVVGMIHLLPLPGTPRSKNKVKKIIQRALEEALLYKNLGVNAIIIENMHDVPYLNTVVGPEISTLMAVVGFRIKQKVMLPCGIQILSSANKAAIAAANSAGLDFIRAEGFVFDHVADEGYVKANAGELLRYRKMIGAEQIAVWTDIKKKHSAHAITADVDVVEMAKAAEYFLSDGLILTGSSTGEKANIDELKAVKKACNLPVIVGSGITIDNVADYWNCCDAMIIGSHFKKDGHWANKLDAKRIQAFMDKIKQLQQIN